MASDLVVSTAPSSSSSSCPAALDIAHEDSSSSNSSSSSLLSRNGPWLGHTHCRSYWWVRGTSSAQCGGYHCCHFTIAVGASMADMDSLFTGPIHTKVLISLVSNYAFRQHLAKESLQLRTYRTEFSLPDCRWTPTTGPALTARLYARPVCWDLPCPTEVQWQVPQLLEQWNVCRTVRGWHHAVVLGPDARRQQRCGLSIPQTSGHRQSQSEIRQALAVDHHTDSLCPVWYPGGCWRLPVSTPLAPACMVPGCLPDQQGSWRGCWRTLTGCFPQGLSACRVLQFFWHRTTGVYLTTVAEHGLPGHMVQYKMLHGLFSRSCGLYALYFLAMCSWSVPLGIITGEFQEYDFAYSEAQIRCLLGWHRHAYTQQRRPLIVIRPPVYIGETVNASILFFLAMETLPSSCSPLFWPWDLAALMPGSHVHGAWGLARCWPLP